MTSPTLEQIQLGIEKVFTNSADLLKSARTLQGCGDFPRAYALAHLGSEEMAKVMILCNLAMHVARGRSFKVKLFKRNFRDHLAKTANVMCFDDIMTGEPDGTEEDNKWRALISNHRLFNTLKNQSFYVVWDENGDFHLPADTIVPQFVELYITVAEKRLAAIRGQQPMIWDGILKIQTDKAWSKIFFKKLAEFNKDLLNRMKKTKDD